MDSLLHRQCRACSCPCTPVGLNVQRLQQQTGHLRQQQQPARRRQRRAAAAPPASPAEIVSLADALPALPEKSVLAETAAQAPGGFTTAEGFLLLAPLILYAGVCVCCATAAALLPSSHPTMRSLLSLPGAHQPASKAARLCARLRWPRGPGQHRGHSLLQDPAVLSASSPQNRCCLTNARGRCSI